MYVLCAGMYRACSTWQYEVIAHLLEQHGRGRRLGYLTGEEFAARERSGYAETEWGVLKSHEGDRSFARAIKAGRAIAVYAHRDIRDVVFSLMHKRGVSFEQLLRQGMIHQILVNDRFWSRQPGVLVQRYESLIEDPAGGVLELAALLGLRIGQSEAAEVASEYSFQTNRRRTQELVQRLTAQGVDLSDPSNLQYYDQETLLHWNHMREGRPGNWRTHATTDQRAMLARLCDRWLIAHGYEADTREPAAPKAGAAERLSREIQAARAWVACEMRCASLRYPRSARRVKQMLGISTATTAAVPARAHASSQVRVDPGRSAATQPASASHSSSVEAEASLDDGRP